MKLSDIFFALASGEISNLSCVLDGEINPNKYQQVITAINRALVNLGTRFTLNKGYLVLQTRSGTNTYVMSPEYAVSVNPNGYILDTDTAFTEPFLEMLCIVDTATKVKMELDGSGLVTRLAVNTLRFHQDPEDKTYLVHYTALPALIDTDLNDPVDLDAIEVDLPLAYLNALIYFVASTFYAPTLSGMDGVRANMDINYRQMYEAECKLLETRGIDIDEVEPTNLFAQRGFI